MMSIFSIAVEDVDLEKEALEEIIAEVRNQGGHVWEDAEEFLSYSAPGEVSYFEKDPIGNIQLAGCSKDCSTRTIVSFNVWYDTAMDYLRPASIPAGFTRHDGSENPLEDDALVRVYMRGNAEETHEAKVFRWDHQGTAGDIIAYQELTVQNTGFITSRFESVVPSLIALASQYGQNFWKDGYTGYKGDGMADRHITFFDSAVGFDGNVKEYVQNKVLVTGEQFLLLLKKRYEEKFHPSFSQSVAYVVPPAPAPIPVSTVVVKGDQGDMGVSCNVKGPATPRHRKKRQPVPKQTTTIVRILYTTQQVYTLKGVMAVDARQDEINIVRKNVIEEGIEERVTSIIDSALVMAIIISEPDGKTLMFRNIDGTWESTSKDGMISSNAQQLYKEVK